MNFLTTFIGTFAYSGFFPFAPATFASFVFLVLYAAVPGGRIVANPYVSALTLIASVPISSRLEKRYGRDARCIVIDEIVGLQAVLVWARPEISGIVATFFLFRFFDIAKPFPVARSQRLPGGFGVVCDDFLAGIYTRATLIILAFIYPAVGRFG